MKTVILLEGILFVSCFIAATVIVSIKKNIKLASLLLYGFLLCWFVVFYIAIPYLRYLATHDESIWITFADSPVSLIFFLMAAFYSFAFAGLCVSIRWAYSKIIRQENTA